MAENVNIEAAAEKTAVIFESAGELYAFEIGCLTEISSRTDITHVPKLPDYITGVINLMGDVIPVMDFRRRLGFEDCEYDERSCIMVVESNENTAAVKVDRVLTSISYTESDLLQLPEESSIVTGYLSGEDGRRISIINEAKLFER